MIVRLVSLTVLTGIVALASFAWAQTSSLYRRDLPTDGAVPLTLADSSWVYQEVEKPQEIQLHSIITVVIDEKSQVVSEGEVQRRKKAKYDAVLKDWIRFEGLSVRPAIMADGDPRINGSLDSEYRADMELETADGMRFRIAAKVVDIRPNGNLVLEAHRTIRNNDEVWEQSLTGIVRREDVLPNNTVLSEDVAELSIYKREKGHVRDGYRRGWFIKFYDAVSPF